MDNFVILEQILIDARDLIAKALSKHELLHEVKPKLLGRDSEIIKMAKSISEMSIEGKKAFGSKINEVKKQIEILIKEKEDEFENKVFNEFTFKNFDITAPVRQYDNGSIHPISYVTKKLIDIFRRFGFQDIYGPEIEEEFYNFDALNMPKNHPARQMQDSFYFDDNYLLRTHTTCVDIRKGIENKPPFKFVSSGKVFRVDSDATHSPMFHQLEMVAVDKGLNMSHLRFYLEIFLKEFFEIDDLKIRFRPSFFPFTCPSAEIDIAYEIKNGKIEFGKGDKYLEILGCGVLHPNVLKNMKIDPNEYSGIAFGCGIERLAMLKYGIKDIRDFYKSDLSWLEHYAFSFFND